MSSPTRSAKSLPPPAPPPQQPELHLVRDGRDHYGLEANPERSEGRRIAWPKGGRLHASVKLDQERLRKDARHRSEFVSDFRAAYARHLGLIAESAKEPPKEPVKRPVKRPEKSPAKPLERQPAQPPKKTPKNNGDALAALGRMSDGVLGDKRSATAGLSGGKPLPLTGFSGSKPKEEPGGLRLSPGKPQAAAAKRPATAPLVRDPKESQAGRVPGLIGWAGPIQGPSPGGDLKVGGILVSSHANGSGEKEHSADLSPKSSDKVEIAFGAGIPRGTRGLVRTTFFRFSVSKAELSDPRKRAEARAKILAIMEQSLERNERMTPEASREAVAQLQRVVDRHLGEGLKA